MKITQAFWTRNSFDIEKLKGSWLDLSFKLMCWSLSSHSISQFYDIELLTDDFGYELLVEKLKLPYKKADFIYNDYDYPFSSKLWCFNKIHAYSLQEEPFLNFDGDVFIWKPFPKEIMQAPLIAQNLEIELPSYKETLQKMRKHFPFLPDLISRKKPRKEQLLASNAGVFGGSNLKVYKELRSVAFEMLDKNRDYFHKVPIGYMNIMAEQYLFNLIASKQEIPISFVVNEPARYPDFLNLHRFHDLPNNCDYIHIMGAKKSPTVCEQMAERLLLDNPEMYHRCKEVSKGLSRLNHFISSTSDLIIPKHQSDSAFRIPQRLDMITGPLNGVIPTIFYRTHAVLRYLNLAQKTDWSSILKLKKSIKKFTSQENRKAQIIRDVFEFELEKFEFVQKLPDFNTLLKEKEKRLKEAEEAMKLNEQEFSRVVFQLNPNQIRLKSAWCWTEKNELFRLFKRKGLGIANNLKSEPAYFETALYLYLQQGLVLEHLMDGLNTVILNCLEAKTYNFSDLAKEVKQQLQDLGLDPNKEVNEKTIYSRLNHFLLEGLVIVQSEKKLIIPESLQIEDALSPVRA